MEIMQTSGQLTVPQRKVTPPGCNRILSTGINAKWYNPEVLLNARNVVRFANTARPKQLTLPVDFGRNLEQMIAAGQYDWWNEDITPGRFVIRGKGVVDFEPKLFYFSGNISSEKAVEKIRGTDTANPWEPGRIEHLLSYGAEFPDGQLNYPIVALASGATLFGIPVVAYLDRNDEKRILNLYSREVEWLVFCRFLGVRRIRTVKRLLAV